MLGTGAVVLSLLWLRQPSYDPTAWLIWGRQIVHGGLSTSGGPSWKPLPVLLTTAFAVAGSTVAPLLWLTVTRAAGLGAFVLLFLLARRLGGRVAALVAVAALAVSSGFIYNTVRGDSEGLLVLLVLGATLAQVHGRRRVAFVLGVGMALIRPEAWLLVGVLGIWLLRARPGMATTALVLGSAVLVPALWIVPELIGSGDALRAATRARNPVPGTPGQAAHPFFATLAAAVGVLPWPVELAALGRLLLALRTRTAADRVVLVLAAGAAIFLITVALLAQLGFTGNARYATAPAAVTCLLGGLGVSAAVAGLRGWRHRRAAWIVISVAGALVFVAPVRRVEADLRFLEAEETVYRIELPYIVAQAGGLAAIRSCGPLTTTPFARQAVAYALRVPQRAITTGSASRGTLLGWKNNALVRRSPLPPRLATRSLALRSTCPLGA